MRIASSIGNWRSRSNPPRNVSPVTSEGDSEALHDVVHFVALGLKSVMPSFFAAVIKA